MTTARFAIGATDFELDGRPHRILSGALHYFRIHPDLWADRIHKARLMGLNTIETYVAWNAHEPQRGSWRADDGLDLGRFLDLVAAEGMHAVVRPGPYICAEWDNGGLPAWLLRDPEVGVRRSEPHYLAAVSEYLRRVYAIVAPRQIDVGGPVVLVQIENEYGAYGSDKEYLAELVRVTRDAGITVPLTTIDQPTPQMLADGSLPGLHLTGSFGSRTPERLATLREFQPTGPLMCMEFWCGWFDDWGTQHHTTDADASARELDALLAVGGSVNIYMFHGGTNFGLTSGANDKGRYAAITTSYDYDAPLDEGGDPTAKFWAFRDVIARYAPVPAEVPAAKAPAPTLTAPLVPGPALLGLDAAFGPAARIERMASFDDLGHDDGFVLFQTTLSSGAAPARLVIGEEVRDRAWVLLDGVPIGVLARDNHERALTLPSGHGELAILVENQGRVNYGTRIGEHKGLIGGVRLDGTELTGWTARPLALPCVPEIAAHASDFAAGPGLASGTFDLDAPADLYVDTLHWGKGLVWVNGFLLGRYWRRGPQRTLIVPTPVTRAGRNDVVVLELESIAEPEIRLLASAELGHTEV
ncbi:MULTISPECIES: glycoside hydrolase family 35 protein [unclassified Rathayibacter]|uniref:glycoside hydrolase family 35 protein n=1 Tax=unclassified Rathayibacter TaxID=2609250 RepID=UPI0006FBCF4A|nr:MULTISPECIES: beta-galactosidase family protein [unclassified Rathayibacter]KQQ05939.1 beta-galactosidase [Rathayibacter sp. Leaf294]KQS13796.1 beta-galactosidase [Rathayibacter sp. Leaf185]